MADEEDRPVESPAHLLGRPLRTARGFAVTALALQVRHSDHRRICLVDSPARRQLRRGSKPGRKCVQHLADARLNLDRQVERPATASAVCMQRTNGDETTCAIGNAVCAFSFAASSAAARSRGGEVRIVAAR